MYEVYVNGTLVATVASWEEAKNVFLNYDGEIQVTKIS